MWLCACFVYETFHLIGDRLIVATLVFVKRVGEY